VDRGVSTVVDVALALLLVSASVVVVVAASPPAPQQGHDARTLTTLLTATTARVPVPGGAASGTVAGLLADAAALGPSRAGFADAVRDRVNRTLRHVTDPAQVIARPVGGGDAVRVGDRPPPTADVAAVSVVVPPRDREHGTAVRIVTRTWSR
jgi:hypothetical protein